MEWVLKQYLWILIVGTGGAWWYGWATGSNDVANAFATSVGAKTLKMWQATVLAIIFEFSGAILLGRVSTSVIAGGIANVTTFARDPEIYAYGMMCNLFVGSAWQTLASWAGLNVSATHTIIGGIIGFALVYGGKDAVVWAKKDPGSFPPTKGVITLFLSWIFAPLLTGSAAAIFFLLNRFFILRRRSAYLLTFLMLPILVFVTVFVNTIFILTKGAKKMMSEHGQWSDSKAAWVSAATAGGATLLMIILLPFIKKRADVKFAQAQAEKEAAANAAANIEAGEKNVEKDAETAAAKADEKPKTWYGKVKYALTRSFMCDIHEVVEEDPIIKAIHERAEVFDPKVEFAFMYLQIFSAICVITAHGAGEVGYMAGPLASIQHVVKYGEVTKSVTAPIWCILVGASGLVVGLATYGHRVTRSMGVTMAKLSPSRGYCAELATAAVIMIAAQYGIPQSSSQCITGAIVGVGLCEGAMGVNWRFFAAQFASWMGTLFIAGFITAGVFAQGAYAPSIPQGNQIIDYENLIANTTLVMNKNLNTTLFAFRAASQANAISTLPPALWSSYNKTLVQTNSVASNILKNKVQTITTQNTLKLLSNMLSINQNNTILTLGQTTIVPGVPLCVNSSATISTNTTNLKCPAPQLLAPAFLVKAT